MFFVLLYFTSGLLMPLALNSYRTTTIGDNGFYGLRWTPFLVLALFLAVGLRGLAYDTGVDYLYYFNHYSNVNRGVFDAWGERSDFGYKILVQILAFVSARPELFFILASAFYMVATLKFASIFGRAVFYIVLVWPFFLFILSMNLYRQYLAISTIYLIVSALFHRRTFVALILSAVAISFHFSSIIAIFVLFGVFLFRKTNVHWLIPIIILLVIYFLANRINEIILFSIEVFQLVFSGVKSYNYSINIIGATAYEPSVIRYVVLFINCIWIWLGFKISSRNVSFRVVYYLSIISFFLYPISQQEILSRIHLYFLAFVPFMIGILLYEYRRTSYFRFFLLCCTVVFYLIRYVYYLFKLGQDFPYRSLLFSW